MAELNICHVNKFIQAMPDIYKGPGGAVAVIKDGEVIAKRVWGFADLQEHRALTSSTLMPICSISKEFTCALLLDLFGEPEALDADFAKFLSGFEDELPSVRQLCNNQSGLRDYWALTVLCGALPENKFTPDESRSLLQRMRTTHFKPGSQYSYNNGNFRILCALIEQATGEDLGSLLKERIFNPAGMKTAELIPDNGSFTECIGYEGNVQFGYIPAVNRIHWSGDAGICASLDDMIAWEQFIDKTRDDKQSLYQRIAIAQPFNDGEKSPYNFGLNARELAGRRITGHGGALRGWRCQRFYSEADRLSVVVMFNHQSDASGACLKLMQIALDAVPEPVDTVIVDPDWYGDYLDPVSGLVLSLSEAGRGQMKARFATSPEIMNLVGENLARSASMELERNGDVIKLARKSENLFATLHRLKGIAKQDIVGRFYSEELDAEFVCVDAGGALYASFEGFLGKSPMQPLYSVGEDVWLLPNQRSMDAPAPGDWSIIIKRDEKGRVSGLQLGCWLARGVTYNKRI